MLDPVTRALWEASAATGNPPDIATVARMEYGCYVNWHIDESFFALARRFLKDRTRIDMACFEMSRSAGKSIAVNLLRLYIAEWILPYAKDPYGNPLRPEQKVMTLVGRNEDHLRDMIFKELKSFIIENVPWLRTDDWLTFIGDTANPDPHGIKAIANMPSKGAQKWEAYRLDLANGITFLGRSIRQSVRGLHGLYLDADDLLEEANAHESPEIYELLLSSHAKTLEAGGLMLVDGTPQDPNDVYKIIADSGRFDYRQYPAYDEDGSLGYAEKNRKILGGYYFANLPKLDRACLWPTRMSWAFLEQDRGTSLADNERFQRERMLKRVTVGSALVHPDYIEAAKDETLSYHMAGQKGFHYYLGHDPSSLKKDNAAWCVGYFDSDKNLIPAYFNVLDANPHLKDGDGEMAVVLELNAVCKQFSYPDGVVEANGFQGVLKVVGRMLDPSMISHLEKFQLGKNKHTEAGWLGIRTVFRMRKVRLPYKTPKDQVMTNAFLNELRGIQYKGGLIVEDRRKGNDRVSAFFLMLKATEMHEAILSGSVLSIGPNGSSDGVALPGHRSFPKPFTEAMNDSERSRFNARSRPQAGSLSEMRARMAKWQRTSR